MIVILIKAPKHRVTFHKIRENPKGTLDNALSVVDDGLNPKFCLEKIVVITDSCF